MPFLTEAIWLKLPNGDQHPSIVVADWPDIDTLATYVDSQAKRSIDLMVSVVGAIRSTRARYQLSPKTELSVVVRLTGVDANTDAGLLLEQSEQIAAMASTAGFSVGSDAQKPAQSVLVMTDDMEVYIVLEGLIDFEAERERLSKEFKTRELEITKLAAKLDNVGFTSKAAPEVVQKTRDDLERLTGENAGLQAKIDELL
jgi:valyl-tRNA synthetase